MPDILEEIDELLTVEGLKDNWAILTVGAVFMLALYLRYLPEQGMKYLQALDPYMIYRVSQHVALEGNLPHTDFMRYFPYNIPLYMVNQGDIIVPAIMYWLGPFLFFENFLEWAQFYPALLGSLSAVMAYFLGTEIFDRITGVSSAFFVAVISGIMSRSSAGWFEKEPIGTFFMMTGLYFFTRAWKRDEWISGILSGVSLGLFTISWGGSKMSWLLYPLVVGAVIFMDEDIESLIKAYTPTVLIGGMIAFPVNPTRFWFTDALFLANIGLLGLLWSRYALEEFEMLEENQLRAYIPSMYVIGGVALALSPLYSDFLARRTMGIVRKVTQNTGRVIGGTVAENTGASLGQLISQLSAIPASNINPMLGSLSYLVGTWTLAFIGVSVLGSSILAMVLQKFGFMEKKVETGSYYKFFGAIFFTWTLIFSIYFSQTGAGAGSVLLAVFPAVTVVFGAMAFTYSLSDLEKVKDIEFQWYYILPFFWTVSNMLGAVSKSRLIFLAAFPVAFTSGYTFSIAIKKLKEMDYLWIEEENKNKVKIGLIAALVGVTLIVNAASGFATASRIGGSPNNAWMQNLDYIESETDEGDVILSWWDYGYWFESIGRRPAVADGGNAGYYTSEPADKKVNFPIADFFTSSNPENHTELFEKHSVDYLVLDNTMIGKYAAVSQISNRDNSDFNSMAQLRTRGSLSGAISQDDNGAIASFSGRGLTVHVSLSTDGNQVNIDKPPVLERGNRRVKIDCVLTENGRRDFNTSRSSQFCLAEDPFRSFERGLSANRRGGVVLVPKSISDASLVRLYLMDGYGIDFIEKVPGASNGFVKMWKIKDLE